MLTGQIDTWLDRAKQLTADRLIRIADVFGHQRQKDFLVASVTEGTGQGVEQKEKGGLPTHGNRDVFGSNRPAEFTTKQIGECPAKGEISGRWLVVAQHVFQLAGLTRDLVNS